MSRKHFGMSVYVYAGSLCLFQQHFQIFQIVTGYENPRA